MKAIKLFVTLMLLGITMGMTAQTIDELESNFSERSLKEIMKAAKKQAKDYKKQGYEVAPGAMPMDFQLYRSYLMQRCVGRIDMQSDFAFGNNISTGQFYSAAHIAASELAKGDLVGKLHTEITREVSAQVINRQLSSAEAESVSGVVGRSKSIVVQRLDGLDPVIELSRKLKNGNVEVMITFAYNRSKAKPDTYKFINEECKKLGIDLNLGVKTSSDMVD